MRVYIAGPMTGIEHYNWPAFLDAQHDWAMLGHTVVTPIEANHIVWQRHYRRNFSHMLDKVEYGDPLMKEIIGEDLKLLASCDTIALLWGWQQSRGALLELHIAGFLNMQVFDARTKARLDSAGRPLEASSAVDHATV